MPDIDAFAIGGEIMAAMRRAWAAEDRPMVAHLDITWRCDLDCVHCYLDQKNGPELTTAEWHAVIDQVADAGVLTVVWSGGEVTLRPDFLELLQHAARRQLVSRIKTHGGTLDATWATHLRDNRTMQVDVSVYSLRPDVHDAFTQRPGSLAATLAGIAAVRAGGLPVRVAVYVLPEAVEEIPQIDRYFRDMGCDVGFATSTIRDNSATTALDRLELAPDVLVRARTLIAACAPKSRPSTLAESGAVDPCQAGRTLAYISPDGDVWPCVNFPMPLGNLRQSGFLDIWRTSTERASLRAWTNADRATCQSCAGSAFCTYCPGHAYKTTGDFRIAPGYFHAEARAKMIAFEHVRGPTFTPAEWSSLPDATPRPPAATRFVFPIHRPVKGAGLRVKRP